MKSKIVFAVLFLTVFCFSSYGIEVSVSKIEAQPGSTAVVDISLDTAAGVAGADIMLEYDPASLEVVDAQVTPLVSSLLPTINYSDPGIVSLSMAGTAALTEGSGAIMEISFNVKPDATGEIPLTLSEVALYDELAGDIPDVTAVDGNITLPAPSQEEINKAIARRPYEDVINQQNLDAIDEIFAPDYLEHLPPNPDLHGPDGVRAYIESLLADFPDTHFVIEDQVAEGNMVVSRWTITGTQKGDFMGIPATGISTASTGISVFHIENGMILEGWIHSDFLGVMQQLGVIEPGRPAPENYTWGEPSEVTGDPGDMEVNKIIAERYVNECWNQGNLDVLDEILHSEILVHNPVIPVAIDTIEVVKENTAGYLNAFPDMNVTVLATITEGDKLVQLWSTSGTHQGELMGISATGTKASWSGTTIYRFVDGKIAEVWWAYDVLGLMQQLSAAATEMMNEAISARIWDEIWNQGNLDLADELVAEDFVLHDPVSGDVAGLEIFKQFVGMYHTAFPDFQFTVEDRMAVGDKVMIRFSFQGTHEGELMGMPASGKQINLTGIVVEQYKDGKAVESWSEWDALGLMQHLEVIPPNRETYGWAPPSGIEGDPGDPEANKAVVIRYIQEFWNDKNLDVLDELAHPEVFSHTPVETINPIVGIETAKEVASGYMEAFPDLHVVVDDLFAKDDLVLERWTATATHQGEILGISPTNKKVIYTGFTLYRLVEGKMTDVWWAWDSLGLINQLTTEEEDYSNVFFTQLSPGLNMISLPLKPIEPYTARSFAEEIEATVVIRYDTEAKKFMGFTMDAPDDGFPIEGGMGYIVNLPSGSVVTFTGAAWTNEPPVDTAAPPAVSDAWAYVVSGQIQDGEIMKLGAGGYTVNVRNLRTHVELSQKVKGDGYFAAAYADLNRNAVVEIGDKIEVSVTDLNGGIVSGPFVREITPDNIRDAVVNINLRLGEIIPERSTLLQNYPNPFNPETWIPYYLNEGSDVIVSIYNSMGQLIRTLDIGYKAAGIYVDRSKAVYWNGKNSAGERVASGLYFYSIKAGEFSATRKMVIKQ
ncbi:T9SS type A sorting domain-containing protein [Candidatus Poribacteria bacterium]|nr:T9SS type A sorting domain-containing protein [Candidatus Poribacteria bacterium]